MIRLGILLSGRGSNFVAIANNIARGKLAAEVAVVISNQPEAPGVAEAQKRGATPYDVKDVELGHHGKECSFEAILKKYRLTGDCALVLLGRIVNGADTDNSLYRQAEGAGLQAVAEGFRHLGFADDHAVNAAEWIVYDALYAYCRETVK